MPMPMVTRSVTHTVTRPVTNGGITNHQSLITNHRSQQQQADPYNKPLPSGYIPPRISSAEDGDTHFRLYLKIIRDVLRTEQPTTLPDLVEDVKVRCARAHIPYAHGEIHRALDRIEHELRLR